MIRIIDGIAYESFSTEHFKLKASDCGNGHQEITASRMVGWREMNLDRIAMENLLETMQARMDDPAEQAKRAENHIKRAATRAKKRVRQLCKVMGVDTMLTLVYKANQQDLDLCKKHVREFNRRVLRILPDFAFVAAFEQQKRGAWHVHMATRRIPESFADRNRQNAVRLKSYEVIRRIWRSVVGELGGNIDVARRKFHSRKSAAQIASYIAKYIIKGFAEGDKWSNRWTKYGEGSVPAPVELGIYCGPIAAIEAAYALLPEGHRVAIGRLDRWRDWFVLHTEPDQVAFSKQ